MKILEAEFLKSCEQPEQFPSDRLPEIAIVGRSNVGKSSLINSLLHRRRLAKISRTPGKTRLVNFIRVTSAHPEARRFYVVDLPGYGYAKVSKSVRVRWAPLIEQYITARPELRAVLLLLDSRGTDPQDCMTFEWLCARGQRPLLVVTKLDKLRRNERRGSLAAVRGAFSLSEAAAIIPYSSVTHEGREELWRVIQGMLASR